MLTSCDALSCMSNLHAGRVEEQEYHWSLDEYGDVVTDCMWIDSVEFFTDANKVSSCHINRHMQRQWRAMGHNIDTCSENVDNISQCSM